MFGRMGRSALKSSVFANSVSSGARTGAGAMHSARGYARRSTTKEAPKLRYFVYTFIFSTATLVFVSKSVDQKGPPKSSFSHEEFEHFEETTKLKRRRQIVHGPLAQQIKFHVVPFLGSLSAAEDVPAVSADGTVVKVINPADLVVAETNDTSRKFLHLLRELEASRKPFPKGLITALVKESIQDYLQQYEEGSAVPKTVFYVVNYPQTVNEAIKFENDVGDIESCVVLLKNVPLVAARGVDFERAIDNVVGYFDTVAKSTSTAESFAEVVSK